MVFRNSKYTFNAWKDARFERNVFYTTNFYTYLNFRNFIGYLSYMTGLVCIVAFYNRLMTHNNYLYRDFEKKKVEQIASDYYIYTLSKRGSYDNVDQLSLL